GKDHLPPPLYAARLANARCPQLHQGHGLALILATFVWNSKTRKVIQTLEAHPHAVFSVAFHPDGKHLASVGADQQVKVWDWKAGEQVFAVPCEAVHIFGTAYCVGFSPDGRQLAAGSDGAVQVWDWRSRQRLHTFPGQEKGRTNVAFSRNGRR